ncbi:GT2 family glycosyltransferase [Nitrobacteraceae bacterium AZCC 2161]
MPLSNARPEFERGPLVTIAIPTFNRASWLRDCVLSALSQTCQHFELLISDNASTDETPEVLKEFTDPRIRVVRQKANIGLIPNWNACLACARGDYIVFVSDDDRIQPLMLECCIALLEREPNIPVVIGLCDRRSAVLNRTWPATPNQRLGTGVWDGTDVLLEYFNDDICIAMCSILIRTSALRAIGGFPVEFPYVGDMAAWSLLLLTGKAGLVNEACATFHHHGDSATSRSTLEGLIDDERRFADRVVEAAGRLVVDSQKCGQIILAAKRYFARRCVRLILDQRKTDGQLKEALLLIWRSRNYAGHIGRVIGFTLAREVALILLPKPIIQRIRESGVSRSLIRRI